MKSFFLVQASDQQHMKYEDRKLPLQTVRLLRVTLVPWQQYFQKHACLPVGRNQDEA
jgi:hypothetical protein